MDKVVRVVLVSLVRYKVLFGSRMADGGLRLAALRHRAYIPAPANCYLLPGAISVKDVTDVLNTGTETRTLHT